MEFFIKVISNGLCFNYRDNNIAYFRSWWNILDFIVLATSISVLVFGDSVTFLKSIRILRALRPLRVISRNISL